jgi:hypothetical protein
MGIKSFIYIQGNDCQNGIVWFQPLKVSFYTPATFVSFNYSMKELANNHLQW